MKEYIADMRSIVSRRVSELRTMDVESIRRLPPHSTEQPSEDERVICNLFHEVAPGGEHVVVVQAVRDKWFGVSTAIVVDGFAIAGDGTTRDLTEQDSWKYD